MALHLNLYHEIHRQQQKERRDPLKLATLGILVLMLCLVLFYFFRTSQVSHLSARRSNVKVQWGVLEPQMKAAVDGEPAALARQKSNKALVERVQQRFFWGPFLEKFGEITPANVQITTLNASIETDKEGKRTVNVLVKGTAAGALPRTSAEDYRRTLQESFLAVFGNADAVFDSNSLEDSPDTVQLNNQTLPTATFRIRLQFQPTVKPASTSEKSK